jgi:hypothetical protein
MIWATIIKRLGLLGLGMVMPFNADVLPCTVGAFCIQVKRSKDPRIMRDSNRRAQIAALQQRPTPQALQYNLLVHTLV